MSRELVQVLVTLGLIVLAVRATAVWVGRKQVDEAQILLAQTLSGRTTVDDEGDESFVLGDDVHAVEIYHVAAMPELAAERLTDVAHGLILHAEWIRGKARRDADWADGPS